MSRWRALQRDLQSIVHQAGEVIWNGPLGLFEFEAFRSGTQAITHAVETCKGFTSARRLRYFLDAVEA